MQIFPAFKSLLKVIWTRRTFESWLIDTCSNPNIDKNNRKQQLIEWEKAPHARYCHPREEYL